MHLTQMTSILDSESHYFWKSHAVVVSRQTPSVLPCEVVYIILRYVPTWAYANLYDPGPPPYDCAMQFDPWSYPDLDKPKSFGDY